VDFGIARFVAAPAQRVTAIGTMGYAPPELFAGKVEPRSDIYSLGATMFHLLTGRDPQDNPLLMFDFSRNPRPRQINPKLSEGIDRILAKSVEHKPANRFSSALEMKEILEQHLRQITSDVKMVSVPSPQASGGEVSGASNFCGQCGAKVNPNNAFCQSCGSPQKSASAPLTPATLVHVTQENQQFSFPLGKETLLVGRVDNNRGIYPDIDLSPFDKDGKVSRRHAIIHRNADKISVEDLNSTNGTYINRGERLQPKKTYQLKSGDEVCLGETFLRFFVGDVPDQISPPLPIKAPVSLGSTAPGGKMSPATSPSIKKDNLPDAVKASFMGANVMSPPPPPPPPSNVQPKLRSGVRPAPSAVNEVSTATETPASVVSETTYPTPIKIKTDPPTKTPESSVDVERDSSGRYILRYFSNIDFPKQVNLGTISSLQVGLVPKTDKYGNTLPRPNPYDGEIVLSFPDLNAVTSLAMEIYIAAPGFEVEPDIFARFNVSVNRSANVKPFQLKAVQVGATVVTVDFYQDTDYLTSVSLETVIVE
jgi:serine/threonine protein kinase